MTLFGLIYHVLALLIFSLGIFVLYDDSRDRINRSFFFYTLGALGWMLSLYWGYYLVEQGIFAPGLELFRFAFAFSAFAMTFMTVFFYQFPRATLKVNEILQYLFYAATAVLVVFAVTTPFVQQSLIIKNGVYVGDSFGPLYPYYSLHILLNMVLSIFFSVHTYYKLEGIEKKKVAYAIVGYFAFVSLAIITNVILPIFDLFLIQREVPLLSVFFIFPSFIAMHRYRFFNLSFFSFNLLRSIGLYSGFVLFAILALSFVHTSEGINLFYFSFGILLALMAYEKVKQYFPRLFVGSLRQLKTAMNEFRSKIYYADSYSKIKDVLDEIFVLRLHFVKAEVYVVRKNADGIKIPVYTPGSFTNDLRHFKKDLLVRDEISYIRLNKGIKKRLLQKMKTLGADVCLPLFSENNMIGFLTLQRKDNSFIISKEVAQELITIRKPLEISLMNLLLKLNLEEENNMMKGIIEKKTKELKRRIKEINELLKQQADFIAVTAHEFRTPLSIATFQLEDVLSSKKPPAQCLEDLSLVESSIKNLKSLTDKLFRVQQYDLNKVELKLEKASVTDFVEKLYHEFSPIMKRKGLKFSLEKKTRKKLQSKIDQSQLRQVLHNLLTNASKFTPKKGQVRLYIGEDKGLIDIRVDDSGEGIPADMKKSIFEKFRTKNAGAGIGLGLYLCKKIVELHKGKIWIEDSPLGGASFRVRLKKSS